MASFIADELQRNPDLTPAEIVILARLRVNDVEDRIKAAFHDQGLKVRNEARALGGIAIQDLVKEKAYSFLLASSILAKSSSKCAKVLSMATVLLFGCRP